MLPFLRSEYPGDFCSYRIRESRDKALADTAGVAPFESMEGMVLKDSLFLRKPIYSNERELKKWVDFFGDYLLSLPLEEKKGKEKETIGFRRIILVKI